MHQWINCDSAAMNDRPMPPSRLYAPFHNRPTTSKARPTSDGYCGTYFFHTADPQGRQTQSQLVQRYRKGAGFEPNVEASINRLRNHRETGTAFVLGQSQASALPTNHPHYTYTGDRPDSRAGLSNPGTMHIIPATSDVVLRDNKLSSTIGCRQNFLTLMAKPPPTAQAYYRIPSEAEKSHARHQSSVASRDRGMGGVERHSSGLGVPKKMLTSHKDKDVMILKLRADLAQARAQASARQH